MGFASNLAAMNAAKQFMKTAGFDSAAYKEFFKIEKIDGEWHSLQIQAFPEARDPALSLMDEREGAWAFPSFDAMEAQALTSAIAQGKLQLIGASQADAEKSLADAMQAADALANAQQATSTLSGKEWVHVSSVAKPTKFVWHIADEMNDRAAANGQAAPSRKEVQDECIRRGVASGTARTQYQAWKKARDESSSNAAHAAALSAKFNKSRLIQS